MNNKKILILALSLLLLILATSCDKSGDKSLPAFTASPVEVSGKPDYITAEAGDGVIYLHCQNEISEWTSEYDAVPADYGELYSDANNLYDADRTALLNYIGCGLPDGAEIIPLADGSFFCVRLDRESLRDVCEILTPADGLTVLTLASSEFDHQLRDAAAKFNRTSDSIRINIEEYDSENPADIYDLSVTDGKLENLYPYLDPELFHDNILSAFELDGALYGLPLSFYIELPEGNINGLETIRANQELFEDYTATEIAARAVASLGISAASKHKDEAWEFLSSLLSEENQVRQAGIPITKAGLGAMIYQALMEYDAAADAEILRSLIAAAGGAG